VSNAGTPATAAPRLDPASATTGLGRSRFAALLFLFFTSGVAALIYEVLWLKELGRLFGVTAHAAAATLAVFFLGLSAGGLVWGRRAARIRNPLRTYAWLEAGIAATAVLYFGLLAVYHRIYAPLYDLVGGSPTALLLVKLLLAVGILFLPAFFMGGTLPVMAQFMIRERGQLGRMATLLYALNTIGAATGALLAGFYLPAVLGFTRSYLVAIALNLVIAVIAAWWSRGPAPQPAEDRAVEPVEPASDDRAMSVVWIVAAVSGFLTLALEVLWTRMYAQVLQNSVYTFAVILTVFLVSLALGSALAHVLCRRPWSPRAVLFWLLVLSGLLVGWTPLVFYRMTAGLQPIGSELGWTEYITTVFVQTLAVLLVPGMIIGAVFPFSIKLCERSMRSAGKTIGQLASVNTLAAILGSLAAGFVLLDWIGLWASIRLIAGGYFALALTVFVVGRLPRRSWLVAPPLGILLFTTILTYDDFADVHLEAEEGAVLLEVWEGSHGTVTVIDKGGDLRIKVNNSYKLGTSNSTPNQRIQSYLPLSLHPAPKSVFYLGMGTGITAGGALDFPVERVVVTELNGDVVEASRKYFGPNLNGLHTDPRVAVVVEDGRNYLAGTRERFDAIIADIFLTYRAGVGSLYTKEHFEAVRERLEPGGIFAQWVPMFDLTEDEFGIIARTMLEVFPDVTLWRRSISPTFPVYALIAQQEERPLDLERLASRFGRLSREGALPEGVWLSHIPLAAYAGNPGRMRSRFAGYPLSTDDWPPLEYLSPVTERESKGAHARKALAWNALADFCESLLETEPPERDPYLANVSPVERNQVPAGLAIYEAEVFRRQGRTAESRSALERYRSLLRLDAAPPAR
jgi:spermidine synthase